MPRRRFALALEIQRGDQILMVDNAEDGLTWRPGTETAYYQVTSEPVRKIVDVDTQSGRVPRHSWWMTVERAATEHDPTVWSDGKVVDGRVIRRAFFIEDHSARIFTP